MTRLPLETRRRHPPTRGIGSQSRVLADYRRASQVERSAPHASSCCRIVYAQPVTSSPRLARAQRHRRHRSVLRPRGEPSHDARSGRPRDPHASQRTRLRTRYRPQAAAWKQVTDYFTALDRASPRMSVRTLGPTTLGRPFLVAFIRDPATLANLPNGTVAHPAATDGPAPTGQRHTRVADR